MMAPRQISRREALATGAAALLAVGKGGASREERFHTRGVVIYPWDLDLADWPERAARAGITTIALHAAQRMDVLDGFMHSDRGSRFLADCQAFSIEVEYELHALGLLLSRELFYSPDIDMFRMNEAGARTADLNCCPSSARALERITENAVAWANRLKPTTGRYFFWPDDGGEWCQCPKCRELSCSDQALLVENALLAALRDRVDPTARLSHIAYGKTLAPPTRIKPLDGLFLEFAPISRVYDHSMGEPNIALPHKPGEPASHGEYLELLDANLEVFDRASAQVLEYWLDVSRFSSWKRPAVKIPWNDPIVRADADIYARRGIRHVTTFATWIDADYVARFGAPPLDGYVNALRGK